MIKFSLITLLILSFFGVTVLGAWGMSFIDMHSHQGGCIASLANGFNCPNENSPWDFAYFHIDAFKSFSNATLSDGLVSLIAVLVWLIGVFIYGWRSLTLWGSSDLAERLAHIFEPVNFSAHRHVLRWLSLHENSPTNAATSFRLPASG